MKPAKTKRPTVPQVLPLTESFYLFEGNGTGGHLHVVLEGHNVDSEHVEFCIRQARRFGDMKAELLGRVLKQMSRPQRLRVAKEHGRGFCLEPVPLSDATFLAACMRILLWCEDE